MKTFLKSLLCALALGALTTSVSYSAELKPDADGFIRNWLMLAPIPLEEGELGGDAVGYRVIRNEPSVQPKAGETLDVVGNEVTWKVVASDSEIFDFNKALGEQTDNSIGFLLAYLDVPEEMKDVNLLASGNDQTRVYLNGKAVSTVAEARALSKDSDLVEGLTLKKGMNTVMLKVVNESNNWQGCLRFTSKDGKPITNYTVKLAP